MAAARLGRPAPTFGGDVLSLLSRYSWPGNVRELRNVVDAMVTLNDSGHIGIDDLPPEIVAVSRAAQQCPISPVAMLPSASDLKSAERLAILTKLRECGGNVTETARRLGIARSTLYARLAEYGELHSMRPRCFVRHLDSRTSNRPNHERSQTQHTD